MRRHDDLRVALGGYALGTLERPERDAVREHVDACGACRAELRQLSAAAALVPLAREVATSDEPSPLLGQAVLQNFGGAGRAHRPRLRIAVLSVLGCLLAAAAPVALLRGDGATRATRVTLAGTGGSATADIRPDAGGARVELDAALAPGGVYEVWFGRLSAGTFRVPAGGQARVTLNVAAPPRALGRIGITRGPAGPTVAAGRLRHR